MPPIVRILVRGTGTVLALVVLVAGVAGVLTRSPLVALNAVGFIGVCALGFAVIFHAVALERIGLTAARAAARTMVVVLACSAVVMTAVFVALLTQLRFRVEASGYGYHSVAGIVVLGVLAVAAAMMWRDR